MTQCLNWDVESIWLRFCGLNLCYRIPKHGSIKASNLKEKYVFKRRIQ